MSRQWVIHKQKAKYLWFTLLCATSTPMYAAREPDNEHDHIKILVLIIASDDKPVYKEEQKLWRSYMHYDPEHVEAYFIKANPALDRQWLIEDDTIWAKTEESIKPGILKKTIIAMEALLPRIHTEFDYVIRTNLSSFFIFPRLLHHLKTCPRHDFYSGRNDMTPSIGLSWVCGAGIIFSPDVVELLVANKNSMFIYDGYDDVIIGKVLADLHICVKPGRMIFVTSMTAFNAIKDNIAPNWFHFRLKNENSQRETDEISIYREMVNMFYAHE